MKAGLKPSLATTHAKASRRVIATLCMSGTMVASRARRMQDESKLGTVRDLHAPCGKKSPVAVLGEELP
ncbi:hypothetical protein [Desulfosporosinus burensis]